MPSDHVQQLNAEQLEREIAIKPLVLVDFSAVWCAPCKVVEPLIDQLADELHEHVAVVKLDIDENRDLALNYDVNAIPTVIVFRDGKPAERLIGVHPARAYRDALKLEAAER